MQPRLFFVNVYESNFRVKDEMFKLSEGTGERPTKNNPPKKHTILKLYISFH